MLYRTLPLLILAALSAAAQGKYSGPRPSKPDVPYIKHADSLVAIEPAEAKEEKQKKDDILYIISGATASARTPLASPIFMSSSTMSGRLSSQLSNSSDGFAKARTE